MKSPDEIVSSRLGKIFHSFLSTSKLLSITALAGTIKEKMGENTCEKDGVVLCTH